MPSKHFFLHYSYLIEIYKLLLSTLRGGGAIYGRSVELKACCNYKLDWCSKAIFYKICQFAFFNDEGATWQVKFTQVFNYVLIWKLVARFNCFFFSTLSSFWTGFCVATWYKTYDCDFELLVIIRFTFN